MRTKSVPQLLKTVFVFGGAIICARPQTKMFSCIGILFQSDCVVSQAAVVIFQFFVPANAQKLQIINVKKVDLIKVSIIRKIN